MTFWVLTLSLSFSLVHAAVVYDRYDTARRSQSDTSSLQTTRIGIEVTEGTLNNVFLKGGYTNGDPSRCGGTASNDPCSIRIYHVDNPNATNAYLDWAVEDDYLDFTGAELEQGLRNGQLALGTPTFPMLGSYALELLNSRHRDNMRERRFFWYVELKMDCSNTDGFFEIIVDSLDLQQERRRDPGNRQSQRSSTKRSHPSAPARINFPKNFDFTKLDEHRASQRGIPLPDPKVYNSTQSGDQGRTQRMDVPRANAPKITGWRANMDTVSGPESKPFQIDPIRVINPVLRAHNPRPHGACSGGTVSFEAPYSVDDHFIGLCGYANIFRYNRNYCEINEIP